MVEDNRDGILEHKAAGFSVLFEYHVISLVQYNSSPVRERRSNCVGLRPLKFQNQLGLGFY